MKHYNTKSGRSKKNQKYNKTKKNKKASKLCKRGCRTKDCGHTPFLYGGNHQKLDDLGQNLAYTGEKVQAITPNPHFAYVGKGGFAGKGNNYATSNANYNLANAYPIVNNQYMPGNPNVNWLNSNSMSGGKGKVRHSRYKKKGGYPTGRLPDLPIPVTNDTDTSATPLPPPVTRGGGCGCSNNSNAGSGLYGLNGQKGGCGQCQRGGNGFYKNPLPYPNGLVGTAWTPKISSWPGVNGIDGDSNYLPLNTYSPVDISRQMINVGASKPFVSGGKKRNSKITKKTRKYKGGSWSNSFGQDLINLGRSSFYNMNTSFNALKGVSAPVNPLPWKQELSTF